MDRIGFGFGISGWLPLIFQGLLTLALLVGIVFLIIFLVKATKRAARRDQLQSSAATQAIEILKGRYARGEILEGEYKKILADLEK